MTRPTADLLRAFLRAPDEAHFRPLYEGTKRLVWTLCVRILKDPAEADDAFQSAYCRLLTLAADPAALAREGVDDPEALLCRLAIREADALRKRKSRREARERTSLENEPHAMRDDRPTADAVVAAREVRERVDSLVEALPDALRLPVQLHFFHGLSQRDVARALDVPLATVSDRIRRGLDQLEPPCRRAGLGGATATLAGVAIVAGLFDPPFSAAAVFAHAKAAAVAAAVTTTTTTIFSLAGAIAIMKTKSFIAAAIITLALAGTLAYSARVPRRPREDLAVGGIPQAQLAVSEKKGLESVASPPKSAEAPLARTVVVQVRWRGTDEPAPAAHVSLLRSRGEAPLASAETDGAGRATLEAPLEGPSAWLETRHAAAAIESTEVSLASADAVQVMLTRDAITGFVLDSVTGEAIAGARVSVREPGKAREEQREAIADASGAYALFGPASGTLSSVATADGHAQASAEVNHEQPGESVQDFRLDPAAAADFTVVDEKGAPVRDASITPPESPPGGVYVGDRTVKTDARGKARLDGVSRVRPPSIQVQKDGYKSAYPRPQIGPNDLVVEVRVVLEASRETPRAISGRVTNASGRPIAGATVEWKDGEGTSFGDGVVYGQFHAATDRDGFYRLEYEDDYGKCNLGVAANGWAPAVALGVDAGTPEKPARKDFTLEPGHWLKGRVLGPDSRPIANATLRVMPRRDLLNEAVAYPVVLREATTDAGGRFDLVDLAGPKAGVWIHCHCLQAPIEEMEVAVDQELDLTLAGWGIIRGRVIDADSGEPVTSFVIRLRGRVTVSRWESGESFTSDEGRFALTRLERREKFGLVVEAPGYPPAEVEATTPDREGAAEDRVITLRHGHAVDGVVFDAATGQPLSGVRVGLTDPEHAKDLFTFDWDAIAKLPWLQWAPTGSGGAFSFAEERPSVLMVRPREHQPRFLTPEQLAAMRGPDGRLRIALERGESLAGTLVLGGKPAGGVDVRLFRAGGELHGIVRTSAEGKFRWTDLPAGDHVLQVERELGERRGFTIQMRWPVSVKAGEENEVELGKDAGSVTLRGRLLNLDETGSMWARMTLRPSAEAGGPELSFTTYKEWGWWFACPFLRAGQYAAEVAYYAKAGDRTVKLQPVVVTGDEEREIEVPAAR